MFYRREIRKYVSVWIIWLIKIKAILSKFHSFRHAVGSSIITRTTSRVPPPSRREAFGSCSKASLSVGDAIRGRCPTGRKEFGIYYAQIIIRPYRKIILTLMLILTISILPACSAISVQTETFTAMGATAESAVISTSDSLGKEINSRIKDICGEVEGRISNTIETSEIYKFNLYSKVAETSGINYQLSKETAGLLKTAKYMQEQTNGNFNPFLGDITDLWDINNTDENAVHKLPEKNDFYPALDRLKKFGDSYSITDNPDGTSAFASDLRPPKIDLSRIGKGYALDCIDDYLVGEQSIQNALVSIGGTSLALGKNKSGDLWTVSIPSPVNPGKICGYVSATDKVVSVSAGSEKYITINRKKYCNIIDPDTGYPVDNDLLCVVVVMNAKSVKQPADVRDKYKNNGVTADALSTALYVMGKDKAKDFYDKVDYKNNPQLGFDMILFVKNDSVARGYDIITWNVMFDEIDENSQS